MDDKLEMGFDDMAQEPKTEAKQDLDITLTQPERPKRKPFAVWSVGGFDYKLKLTASAICKLEQKYKKNLMLLITDEGIPPVAVMLTIIQAAMIPYHHGMTYLAVQNVFDQYVEEGGDQNRLMTNVLMPLMGVSGFFTQNQMDILMEEMKELDSTL